MKILLIILLISASLFFVFQEFIFSNILYLRFVINNYKTPQDKTQEEIPSLLNNPEIKIPVVAYKINGPRIVKTYRDKENIINTVEKASNILNQADIEIYIKEIEEIEIDLDSYDDRAPFAYNLFEDIKRMSGYSKNNLNLIFLKRNPFFSYLQTGGTSVEKDRIAFVIDRYNQDDFRILAHEVGHLLGLTHHDEDDCIEENSQWLMEGGLLLTEQECKKAYDGGKKIVDED